MATMAPLSSLLVLSLAVFIFISCRADPDPLQDFCIADLHSDITVNGFPCKLPAHVVSEDFFSETLVMPGNIDNMFQGNVSANNVLTFPGLNTLGLSINRIDLAPGGINVLHSHPRSSELGFVIQGELLVGIVSTSNVFYSKVLKPGMNFIIPRGLTHFLFNIGKENGFVVTAFNSQLPGIASAPFTLFGSKPPIPIEVLTKTFQVDASVIQLLMSKFEQATPYG
jgi:quercetin dioxygenase-like cupin family protein